VWDEIKTSVFEGKALTQTFVKPLVEASRERQESLEEFAFLKKNIDWFKERQEHKTISLNLEQRQALKLADDEFKKKMDTERDLLAKANYAMREVKLDSVLAAEAITPKEVVATIDDGDTDAPDTDAESKFDVHLRESLRVVTDALRLNQDPKYSVDGRIPITASNSLTKG
jgi:carboxyl-terminal processing protease